MADELYECDICGHTTKTRAGMYKHKKSKHSDEPEGDSDAPDIQMEGDSVNADGEVSSPQSPVDDPITDEESAPSTPTPSWADAYSYTPEEKPTITAPTPLKAITLSKQQKSGKKRTKAQQKEEERNNHTMLKMGYKAVDNFANKYKKAINPSTKEIKRAESDYEWVSKATNAYMIEEGMFISDYLSTGKIALIANGWFFGTAGASVYGDMRKAERGVGIITAPVRGIKKVLSYIPVFGKRFRAKPQTQFFDIEVKEDESNDE